MRAIDLTESSKSPASIAQSNKQWVGTCLYQEWCKPLLISCEAAFGYEQVAKRIANIRLTLQPQSERACLVSMEKELQRAEGLTIIRKNRKSGGFSVMSKTRIENVRLL